MADSCNLIVVEAVWYDQWESQGYFSPQMMVDGKPKSEGLFVIPLPPPNVTGSLHIGHVLNVAIEDSLEMVSDMILLIMVATSRSVVLLPRDCRMLSFANCGC